MMKKLSNGVFLSLLFGALLLHGCAAEPEPDFDGGPVNNIKPEIGSQYTFHQVVTDNNGTIKTQDTVVYTVGISPVDIKGRSGAYVFATGDPLSSRTIVYETNGNVSLLVPMVIQGSNPDVQWMTIPLTGSGGSKNLLLSEIETTNSGITTNAKLIANVSLAATENIVVDSKTYSAKKIKVTNTLTVTTGGIPVSKNDDDFYWWIPDLGFYGKSEEGGIQDPTGFYGTDITTETLVRRDTL
jgi:hypothetical protein